MGYDMLLPADNSQIVTFVYVLFNEELLALPMGWVYLSKT